MQYGARAAWALDAWTFLSCLDHWIKRSENMKRPNRLVAQQTFVNSNESLAWIDACRHQPAAAQPYAQGYVCLPWGLGECSKSWDLHGSAVISFDCTKLARMTCRILPILAFNPNGYSSNGLAKLSLPVCQTHSSVAKITNEMKQCSLRPHRIAASRKIQASHKYCEGWTALAIGKRLTNWNQCLRYSTGSSSSATMRRQKVKTVNQSNSQ